MAKRPALIKTKRKVTRAAPTVRRGKKLLGPDFTGWEKWTGSQFNAFKHTAKYFYYDNYQEADLLSEVWVWMKENKYSPKEIKQAKAAKGWNSISIWPAISCKLLHNGCPDFNQAEANYWESCKGTEGPLKPMTHYVKEKIAQAISAGANEVVEEKVEEAPKVATRQNIQEIMKDRASEVFGEIESLADEFLVAGFPKEFATKDKVLGFLNAQKILPQHVTGYVKYWEKLKAEYEGVKLGKDADLVEGYKKYTRTQINNMIKFATQVVDDLNAYTAIKQAARTVRPKKAVPVEKVVSRIKYRKADDTLGLTSVSPTKLHQCTEAFVYDTAKRKIIWLVADDYSKCLVVKGNSVIGFDKKKSMSKTVRKPNEFLKTFMSASRPATRKAVDSIKAVAAIPNGRFNENMVILKVW
jgi:hypothetical protein